MSKIYLSPLACRDLVDYLKGKNYDISFMESLNTVDKPIAFHPDLLHCKLNETKVFHGDSHKLGSPYPKDSIYNGCSTGKYFIHNLNFTDPQLLKEVTLLGLIPLHVSQGYAKCSIVVVDEESIITYDGGIEKQALNTGMKVLKIRPKHISLEGYPTGFIGGCSGKVGKEILFHGNLKAHPNFQEIKDFIEKRGLNCRWFGSHPLRDIGSIIEEGNL